MDTKTRRILIAMAAMTIAAPQFSALQANAVPLTQSAPAAAVSIAAADTAVTTTTTAEVTSGCDDYVKKLRSTTCTEDDWDYCMTTTDDFISSTGIYFGDTITILAGEELDLDDHFLIISGNSPDGEFWDIMDHTLGDFDYTADTSEFDNTRPGIYEIKVDINVDPSNYIPGYSSSCGTYTASGSFKVEVVGSAVTTCETESTTTCTTTYSGFGSLWQIDVPKKVYQIGEELDLTGTIISGSGSVRDGEYWDIFGDELAHNEYIIDDSAFDNTKPGTYEIGIYLIDNYSSYFTIGNYNGTDYYASGKFTVEVVEPKCTTTTVTTTTTPNRMYFAPNTGDVNGDKDMDIRDGVLLARIVGGDTTAESSENSQADINRDQHVDAIDLTLLLRRLAHLI